MASPAESLSCVCSEELLRSSFSRQRDELSTALKQEIARVQALEARYLSFVGGTPLFGFL